MDVVALGELLIDFTENGISAQGNPLFEANPGGAPCNVLAMLSRLGHQTAFIGKVGQDFFGQQLEKGIYESLAVAEHRLPQRGHFRNIAAAVLADNSVTHRASSP